jgi:hypothetical protein
MLHQGQLLGATTAHGVILSHAGVNKHYFDNDNPKAVSEEINDQLLEFFGRGVQTPSLFAHTAHGGRGGISEHGGVFWQDLRQMLEDGQINPSYRQVVGHTPLGGIEGNDLVTGIDVQGPRLGAAIILPDGSVHYTSDVLEK